MPLSLELQPDGTLLGRTRTFPEDPFALAAADQITRYPTSISRIELRCLQLSDAEWEVLAETLRTHFTSLTFLKLCETQTEKEVPQERKWEALTTAISSHPTLSELTLNEMLISPPVIQALARTVSSNPKITSFSLQTCLLGSEGKIEGIAEELKTHPNPFLRALNLQGNNLKDKDAPLADILLHTSGLTELDLSFNPLGEMQESSSVQTLLSLTQLKTLKITTTEIGKGPWGEAFVAGLFALTQLQALYLNDNLFDRQPIHPTALAKFSHLKEIAILDLSYNGFTGTEGKILAKALPHFTLLSFLNLSGNPLGDESAEEIANALIPHEHLTALQLEKTSLGDKASSALAQLISATTTLSQLDIHHNDIGTNARQKLVDALITNRFLLSLKISEELQEIMLNPVYWHSLSPNLSLFMILSQLIARNQYNFKRRGTTLLEILLPILGGSTEDFSNRPAAETDLQLCGSSSPSN